jgi:hypothetical protein
MLIFLIYTHTGPLFCGGVSARTAESVWWLDHRLPFTACDSAIYWNLKKQCAMSNEVGLLTSCKFTVFKSENTGIEWPVYELLVADRRNIMSSKNNNDFLCNINFRCSAMSLYCYFSNILGYSAAAIFRTPHKAPHSNKYSHHETSIYFYICILSLFCKSRQLTKYQFYRRSKTMPPFSILQMLWDTGYPPPILVILEDINVNFSHITEDCLLNDLLHTSQISSKWQFAPFYKTGVMGLQVGEEWRAEICYQM